MSLRVTKVSLQKFCLLDFNILNCGLPVTMRTRKNNYCECYLASQFLIEKYIFNVLKVFIQNNNKIHNDLKMMTFNLINNT